LSPILLESVVKKVVGDCGIGYQSSIDIVGLSVIFGKLIKLYLLFWEQNMSQWEKRQEKRPMLNDGTIRYASV